MDLTEFSTNSGFVQEFALNGDGLPETAPASDVVDTPQKIVVLDAFLRKHAETISKHDIEVLTGLRVPEIQEIVLEFQAEGILELDNSMYTIANMNEDVTELRHLQNSLN